MDLQLKNLNAYHTHRHSLNRINLLYLVQNSTSYSMKICGRKVSLSELTGLKNQYQSSLSLNFSFFFLLFFSNVLLVCMCTMLYCTPGMWINNVIIITKMIHSSPYNMVNHWNLAICPSIYSTHENHECHCQKCICLYNYFQYVPATACFFNCRSIQSYIQTYIITRCHA